jgi:hypothetical protein
VSVEPERSAGWGAFESVGLCLDRDRCGSSGRSRGNPKMGSRPGRSWSICRRSVPVGIASSWL